MPVQHFLDTPHGWRLCTLEGCNHNGSPVLMERQVRGIRIHDALPATAASRQTGCQMRLTRRRALLYAESPAQGAVTCKRCLKKRGRTSLTAKGATHAQEP